jgi:hypothetical protein
MGTLRREIPIRAPGANERTPNHVRTVNYGRHSPRSPSHSKSADLPIGRCPEPSHRSAFCRLDIEQISQRDLDLIRLNRTGAPNSDRVRSSHNSESHDPRLASDEQCFSNGSGDTFYHSVVREKTCRRHHCTSPGVGINAALQVRGAVSVSANWR